MQVLWVPFQFCRKSIHDQARLQENYNPFLVISFDEFSSNFKLSRVPKYIQHFVCPKSSALNAFSKNLSELPPKILNSTIARSFQKSVWLLAPFYPKSSALDAFSKILKSTNGRVFQKSVWLGPILNKTEQVLMKFAWMSFSWIGLSHTSKG